MKIQKGIFQGDALSSLLFVIAMMLLTYFGNTQADTKFLNHKRNQPLIVHGRYQTVCQKWKRTGNPNTDSKNIQWRYRDLIWQRKMYHANNKKRKTTNDGWNWTTTSRRNQRAQRKRNLQILGILEDNAIKHVEMKEKIKRILQKNEITARNQTTWQISHQRDCPPSKIFGVILKVDKGRTSTNGQENSWQCIRPYRKWRR